MSFGDEVRELQDEVYEFLGSHNHAHASSNNPGGHLCDRRCVSQSLAVWMLARAEELSKHDLHPPAPAAAQ